MHRSLHFRKSVTIMLQSSKWKDALRTSTDHDHGRLKLDSPMRGLIEKFPEQAELVLDKCYKEIKTSEAIGIEMNFEFIEDTFNYEKIEKKKMDTNIIHRIKNLTELNELKYKYQHITESNSNNKKEEGFEEPYTKDFQLRMRSHPLTVMVRYSRVQLLKHPLCLSLIREKWRRIGRSTYTFILLCYLVFLASITTFVLTSPSPVKHPQFYNCSEFFQNQTDRPITDYHNPHVTANRFSRYLVWIMFSFYCIRFIVEETPLNILKVFHQC